MKKFWASRLKSDARRWLVTPHGWQLSALQSSPVHPEQLGLKQERGGEAAGLGADRRDDAHALCSAVVRSSLVCKWVGDSSNGTAGTA